MRFFYYDDDDEVENPYIDAGPVEEDDDGIDMPDEADSGGQNSDGKSKVDKAKDAKDKVDQGKDLAKKGKDAADKGKKGLDTAKKGADAAKTAKKGADAAKAAQAAGNTGKFAKFIAPLMPWIVYVVIVIAIIIAITGLLMFILTMPGAILNKIKGYAQDFGNFVIDAVIGKANNIKPSQIAEVGDFLEQSGYDLHANGFLSDQVEKDGSKYKLKYAKEEINYNDFWDSEKREFDTASMDVTSTGILKDKYGIVYAESDYIKAYLVSDNYVYMIRNNENNLKNIWNSIISGHFFSTLFNGNWGEGLINLYNEGGDIGKKGSNYGSIHILNGILKLLPIGGNAIDIKIDRDSKQMIVTAYPQGIYGVERKFMYDLDGWTGRYGMPLEFLLAVHLSSMEPDLAYDLVKKTDTEIQMILHKDHVTVQGGLETGGEILTADEAWQKRIEALEEALEPLHLGIGINTLLNMGDDYLLNWTIPNDYTTNEELKQQVYDKIKEIIEKYPDEAIAAARQLDTGFDTFIPYIYKVYNHWFRDVYFSDVEDSEDSKFTNGREYINTDVDFEARVGERWTEYEMAPLTNEDKEGHKTADSNSNALQNDYSSGGLGTVKYKLYYYSKDENGKQLYDSKGNLLEKAFCAGDENSSDTYWFTEDDIEKAETQNDGKLKVKSKNKNYEIVLNPGEAESIHKKAVANSNLDYEYYKDVEGNKEYTGLVSGKQDYWVAYKKVENGGGSWTKYEKQDGDSMSDETAAVLYYKITHTSNLVQIEDGQRGTTNSLTKQIFSINKYYQYNGTEEKAIAIDKDRYENSAVKDEYKNYIDGKTSKINSRTEEDPRDENLIHTFSVDRDSLSAFHILTNMGTLDSDAIYHDFKELIVELNFFDKEDLAIESSQVFEWPVPEIGSLGWPKRAYEKSENYFGTLMHSKIDLSYLTEKDNIMLFQDMGVDNEEWSDVEDDEEEALGALDGVKTTQTVAKFRAFESPFDEFEAMNQNAPKLVGAALGEHDVSEYTVEDYLAKTREMCEYMNQVGYDYCVYVGDQPEGEKTCHHALSNGGVHNNKCLLPTYFEDSKPEGKHNVCCATLVSWSLSNLGIMKGAIHGAGSLASWIENNIDCERIEKGQALQAGDILVYGTAHIDINGEEFGGGFKKYNGGHPIDIGAQEGKSRSAIQNNGGWSDRATHALRINWGGTNDNEEKYKGYEGGELVVSPVTGIVLEAGTKQKITNIETGKIEAVGFVKIRVLDKIDYELIKSKAETNDDEEKKKYAGYKYFLEDYMDQAVAGNIFYIEGFNLELFDDNVNLRTDSDNIMQEKDGEKVPINKYSKEEITQVLNKKAKKELEEKEKYRTSAVSYIETSKGIMVKEGTALGTTYGDGDSPDVLEECLAELREEFGTESTSVSTFDTTTDDNDILSERTVTDRPGITGADGSEKIDKETMKNHGNGNYIRYIMRTSKDGTDVGVEKDSIVENVENYLEISSLNNLIPQEYKAWEGDLEILAEIMYHEASYGYLASKSEKFRTDKKEADFEMYCMGFSVVNKLLKQNKPWYGHLYDESRTDMSPLAQVVTSAWYGPRETMKAYIAGTHGPCYTSKELEYAEYCLTWDCTNIKKPYETKLGSESLADGYSTTPAGTVIPRCMCQQGGYKDGASGQSKIILVGFWDHNNNNEFDARDELWGVDRSMEHLIDN